MAAMDFKMQIDKLEGAVNWTKWRRQIELLLRHHDVLDVATGKCSKPAAPEKEDPVAKVAYESGLKAFNKSDALAQLILVGSMSSSNIDLTATCESAKAIWDKLISIYEQSSGQRVDRLMEQFFTCEKNPAEDIVTHVGRLQRNFSELNDELQKLATTEAEYVAANEGAKEVIWLERLFSEIVKLKEVPTLLMDSASAIKLTKNPEFHKRSKHIAVKYHFVREKYNEGILNVEHVEGVYQVADIMTKPLARCRYEMMRRLLGVCEASGGDA